MIIYQREGVGYLVKDLETDKDLLVQTDWDFPGLATNFGWSISSVQTSEEQTVSLMRAILQDLDRFYSQGMAPPNRDICRRISEVLRIDFGCNHDGTDGTVTCPDCGMTTTDFISAAREWLDENQGAEVEDPGYFTKED